MDSQTWSGKIFDGGWIPPGGGEYPVIEPATGNTLGTAGRANSADVQHAAARAARGTTGLGAAAFRTRVRRCYGVPPPSGSSMLPK